MNVDLVAIGDEVLFGYTPNTNGAYLAQMLLEHGFSPSRMHVVGDHPEALERLLRELLKKGSLVITTGGLGPTADDNTRTVLSALFDAPLLFHPELARRLQGRFGKDLPTIEDQATLPKGAHIFENELGTASGFAIEHEGRWGESLLIALPGVPSEMQSLFTTQIIPYMCARYRQSTRLYVLPIHFVGLREHEVDPTLRRLEQNFPGLVTGIYPSFSTLSCHLKTVAASEAEADANFTAPQAILKEAFGAHIFTSASGRIEEALHNLLIERHLTLATAESCTAGALSSALVAYPGASSYLRGGIVAYANDIKIDLLGVSKEAIETYGVTSEVVTAAMAEGVRSPFHADCGVGISGILGPSGSTPTKPVGTICASISLLHQPTYSWTMSLHGNRTTLLERAVREVIATLYQRIKKQ